MSYLIFTLGLVLFIGLVVVHELGHFFAARKNGVEVEEFGIGFPPRAWGKKLKSGLLFSLNWLPLGGFVKLKGEHDADKTPGSYGAASLKAKTLIMLAGVGMNLITAFLLLTLLGLIGMPKVVDDQFTVERNAHVRDSSVFIGLIDKDSPAEKASSLLINSAKPDEKLLVQDKIVLMRSYACIVDGSSEQLVKNPGLASDSPCLRRINSVSTLQSATRYLSDNSPDRQVVVTVERDGRFVNVVTNLLASQEVDASKGTDNPKGYLGIIPTEYTLTQYTWAAPVVAAGLIKQYTQLTLSGIGKALGGLFTGHASEASQQVAGPIGIFVILKDGSVLGIEFILMIIAIISLTLAIMNVLPIPALDGGRLFVTWVFRIVRKPLTQKKEEWIHGSGFALLMVLFVLITIVDVKRNF